MTTCHAKTLMQHHDYVIEIPNKSHNEITQAGRDLLLYELLCVLQLCTLFAYSLVWILLLE